MRSGVTADNINDSGLLSTKFEFITLTNSLCRLRAAHHTLESALAGMKASPPLKEVNRRQSMKRPRQSLADQLTGYLTPTADRDIGVALRAHDR
jgi:hypothetical protein